MENYFSFGERKNFSKIRGYEAMASLNDFGVCLEVGKKAKPPLRIRLPHANGR